MLKKHGTQERHEVLSQRFLARMHTISFSPVICDKIKVGKGLRLSKARSNVDKRIQLILSGWIWITYFTQKVINV
jgi:hypothetical protein